MFGLPGRWKILRGDVHLYDVFDDGSYDWEPDKKRQFEMMDKAMRCERVEKENEELRARINELGG